MATVKKKTTKKKATATKPKPAPKTAAKPDATGAKASAK